MGDLGTLIEAGGVVRIGDRVWERNPVYGLSREKHYARLDTLGVREPLSHEIFSDRVRLLNAREEDIFTSSGERLGEFAIVEPRRAGGLHVTYLTAVRPHFDETRGTWYADVTKDSGSSSYSLSRAVRSFNFPSDLSRHFLHDHWGSAVKHAGGLWLREGSWSVARGYSYVVDSYWSLVANVYDVSNGSRWVGDAKNFDKKLLAKIERLA